MKIQTCNYLRTTHRHCRRSGQVCVPLSTSFSFNPELKATVVSCTIFINAILFLVGILRNARTHSTYSADAISPTDGVKLVRFIRDD